MLILQTVYLYAVQAFLTVNLLNKLYLLNIAGDEMVSSVASQKEGSGPKTDRRLRLFCLHILHVLVRASSGHSSFYL